MQEGGEQPVSKEKFEKWEYTNHFKNYLLLVGNKGKDALEPISNYPYLIELSEVWHGTHAKMRNGTQKDGIERLAIVGFTQDRQLILPVTPVLGTKKNIPSNILYEELHRAKEKAGIVNLVGIIHSHPSASPFSARDLYNLLYEHFGPDIAMQLPPEQRPVQRFFTGVVTQDEAMYAFKTRETFPVRPSDTFPKDPLELFKKHWYAQSGYEVTGNSEVRKLKPDANSWDVSLGIATTHNLAIYKGKINEDLTRIYPAGT
jgi:hypothetical protein